LIVEIWYNEYISFASDILLARYGLIGWQAFWKS